MKELVKNSESEVSNVNPRFLKRSWIQKLTKNRLIIFVIFEFL